jgi:hypothetical protein
VKSSDFVLIAGFIALTGRTLASPVTYIVTVNTSAVTGTQGFIHLQFNGGAQPFERAKVELLKFETNGRRTGEPSITGNVSGVLSNTVIFENSAPLNELYQPLTFGTKFSFTVVLSGLAIDSPKRTSASGSTFAISIYDRTEKPILTNNLSGVAGEIHINVDGSTGPVALPSDGNGTSSVVRFASATTPSPSFAFAPIVLAFEAARSLAYGRNPLLPIEGKEDVERQPACGPL